MAVVVATLHTSHFDFMAVGSTANEAKDALLAGWKRHRREYQGADPHFMTDALIDGDVRFTFLPMGGFARDGQVLR